MASFKLVRDQVYRKKREQRPKLPKSLDEVDMEEYPDIHFLLSMADMSIASFRPASVRQ